MTQEKQATLAQIERRHMQRIEHGTANPGTAKDATPKMPGILVAGAPLQPGVPDRPNPSRTLTEAGSRSPPHAAEMPFVRQLHPVLQATKAALIQYQRREHTRERPHQERLQSKEEAPAQRKTHKRPPLRRGAMADVWRACSTTATFDVMAKTAEQETALTPP